MKHCLIRPVLLAVCMSPMAVQAAEDIAAPAESPWRLGIAVGYGERSNPLIQSDDVPIIVDVDIAWFGERAFFDNGDAGYTFHDNEDYTLSLVGRFNSDRLFFTRMNTRFVTVSVDGVPTAAALTVPDRKFAVEAGLELLTDGPWGDLQVAAYHDISGTHNGFEVYASFARGFRANRWLVEPSIGLSYKSAKQNDYFWGVSAAESGPGLPAYKVGSGIDISARLLASYHIDNHWAVVAVFELEKLASTITASPLVGDDSVNGHYVGLQYRF